MTPAVFRLALLLTLAASACQQTSKPTPSGRPAPTAATADARLAAPPLDAAVPSLDATVTTPPSPAPAAAAMPLPTDLPPFGAKATDRRLAALLVQAVGNNDTGPRDYGALPGLPLGQVEGSLPPPWDEIDPQADGNDVRMLIAAVRADPSSAAARALLADHVRDEAFRVAQLAPLATASPRTCPDCVDELLNARADDGPAVQTLQAKVTPSRARRLTARVQRYLATGDARPVKALFGGKVSYLVECSNCDEPSRPRTMTGGKVMADITATITAFAGEVEPGTTPYVTSGWLRCHQDCCATYTSMLGHSSMYFKAVCFAPDADRVTSLAITAG